MGIAIVVGAVATAIALVGLLGRPGDGRAWPSQVVMIAFPIGVIAAGYAASVGMTLIWALVAALATFLGILLGSRLGRTPRAADMAVAPAAVGLSLVFTALIALGLAVIVVTWAAHLIGLFGNLNDVVLKLALALAAAAYGLGGRGVRGIGRLVLVVLIIGALGMLILGVFVGDVSGLTSPQVPVPAVDPVAAVAYAIGVVLIGAGFPMLRNATVNNRKSGLLAAVIVSLIVLAYLVGMMALYGGAFQLPSLVVNVFPVYTPPAVGAVFAAFITVVGVAVAGSCIHAASAAVSRLTPVLDTEVLEDRVAVRILFGVMGAVVFAISWLAPAPVALVAMLGGLGLLNVIAERFVVKQLATLPTTAASEPVSAT